MRPPAAQPPPGYVRLRRGDTEIVALEALADGIAAAMGEGTLIGYARRHPEARALAGRGTAYAVPLPGTDARVVIRHSRHGGALARLTGDRFLRVRAGRELEVALRLAAAGVATPELVAYATYPAGGGTRRADVATREVPHAADLARALAALPASTSPRPLLLAAAQLLASLTRAGARHPDLNLRNVLIVPASDAGPPRALVADVDRVWFDTPGARRVTERNVRRLARSARKLREREALPIRESSLQWLSATAHDLAHPGAPPPTGP